MTLTQTAYKVYTTLLAERLRDEVEEKEILPSIQTDFRRGMSTIDNIYVVNYLNNRQIEKRMGK